MSLSLLIKIPCFRRFASRCLGLFGLLGGASLAGWAQAPAFGPVVAVGTAVGQGECAAGSTAYDAQGYVYVAGTFSGTVQFGSTTLTTSYPNSNLTQGFVAKLDGAGAYQWVRPLGGPSYSYGGGLVVDAGGTVTITGSFSGPTATVGPFTLVGASTSAQSTDGFVARLDTNGNWLWATSAGGPGSDGIGRPVLDAAGNIYVTGGFQGATIALGTTTLTNTGPGNYDLFIAKLNGQGAWQWARSGGGPNQDGLNGLVLDASGNIYGVGLVQGTATYGPFLTTSPLGNADVLVLKLDANGNWLWLARGGGSGIDEGAGLAVDAAGNAYIAGHFDGPTATFGATTLTNANPNGPSAGYQDAVVAKLSAAGAWQWAVRAGGPDADAAGPIVLTTAGQLLVAGTFASSTAQFGPTTLANTATGVYSANSLFLAALSPATGAWLGATSTQGGTSSSPACLAPDAYGNVGLSGSFRAASVLLGATTLAGQAAANTGFVTLVPMVPTIDTFVPGSGAPGTVVAVTGTGFAGVTQVLFNGISATSFTVQSTTRLLATVPAGATAGPVSVRTSSSTGNSGAPFQPVVLATTPALAAEAVVWPNPAGVGEAWQLQLPAAFGQAPLRAEVRNLLGQLVFQALLNGHAASLLVPRLAPGVYQLALLPTGQPALQRRLVVAD
jgi:hypothetical protein